MRGHKLWAFMMPLFVSGAFQSIYSLINAAVVSRVIGQNATAVIGVCSGYLSMQGYLVCGMSAGFGFVLFRCLGEEGQPRFRRAFWGSLWLVGGIALLGGGLSLFSGSLVSAAAVSNTLRLEAERYLIFLLLGSGCLGLKELLLYAVQGTGDTRFPALLSMAGVVSQTLLTLILIAGLGLGVWACALAILLNNGGLSLCLLVHLLRHGKADCRLLPPGEVGTPLWGELLRSGVAKAGMMALVGVGVIAMQRGVNRFSDATVAAVTCAGTVNELAISVFSAYATASGILTGRSTGRGDWADIRRINRTLLKGSLLWAAVFSLVYLFAAEWVLRLIVGAEAESVLLQAGAMWLHGCCLGYPGLCVLLVCRSALQSMGRNRALPFLGVLEMLSNLVMAALIPWGGFWCVCLNQILKWSLPGLVAGIEYRGCLRDC